jgi:uncharacterized membrane protein YkoI
MPKSGIWTEILGITYWEVKVREGQREFQVKINAETGKVLSSEQDD